MQQLASVSKFASGVQEAVIRLGFRLPSRNIQLGSAITVLSVILLVNLSGKHSLLVLSSLFSLGSILGLLIAVDGGLYSPGGRKKLLNEAEPPAFSMDAISLYLVSSISRFIPLLFSSRFRASGSFFLGLSDFLSVGVLGWLLLRRKEFPITEPSLFYYALAAFALILSVIFRAAIANSFLLDSLWSWSACLEPLAVVPHCVALLVKDGGLLTSQTAPFPVLAAIGRLLAAVAGVIYWVYVTEARRSQYRGVSGLILLCQSVGVCGAVLLAALALKAEISKHKLGDKPLLTLVTKAESAKAL